MLFIQSSKTCTSTVIPSITTVPYFVETVLTTSETVGWKIFIRMKYLDILVNIIKFKKNTVRTVPNSFLLKTNVHGRSLFWLDTDTAVKCGEVKLVSWTLSSSVSEMMRAFKCFLFNVSDKLSFYETSTTNTNMLLVITNVRCNIHSFRSIRYDLLYIIILLLSAIFGELYFRYIVVWTFN